MNRFKFFQIIVALDKICDYKTPDFLFAYSVFGYILKIKCKADDEEIANASAQYRAEKDGCIV